ncbi:hypothetical protein EI94DRAFT_1698087 [Lactarius quietus]|nr:hypothetical protein EI94DRAFT_1698087 [Lactarius quietus]
MHCGDRYKVDFEVDFCTILPKTILRQRFPMRHYHLEAGGQLSNVAKVMDRSVDQVASSNYVMAAVTSSHTSDTITRLIADFLKPHTSSLSIPLIDRAMCCLIMGDFSREDITQVLNSQLDSLAISPEAKQSIIPALLGIAELAKVQLQGTPLSTSLSPPRVDPELMEGNTGGSYQMCQRAFSSNSGSGYTTWYFAKCSLSILMPPTIPQAKTGHLYVHLDTSRSVFLYWMLSIANQWERVSAGVESPLNHDRVLAIRANGEPSWITRVSTVTTKTRKEKEIQEKSVG